MREIKFRAWDKIRSEMQSWDDLCQRCLFINALTYDEDSYLIPMQYTGLKDKNDKEIYEGDIVQFQYANIKKLQMSHIAWGMAGFWIVGWRGILTKVEHHKVEVIGNIWESPQLLEQT